MASRLDLHGLFLTKTNNVYFQPPESVKMHYPAIVYETARPSIKRANDKIYLKKSCYLVTVIDKDPESQIADSLFELPYCEFDRVFKNDNLNHFTFTIYY